MKDEIQKIADEAKAKIDALVAEAQKKVVWEPGPDEDVLAVLGDGSIVIGTASDYPDYPRFPKTDDGKKRAESHGRRIRSLMPGTTPPPFEEEQGVYVVDMFGNKTRWTWGGDTFYLSHYYMGRVFATEAECDAAIEEFSNAWVGK